MTVKYNSLHGASHFEYFFYGEGKGLQYSYTSSHMYCKKIRRIDNQEFIYVERRELDEDSKSHLGSMAYNDYVEPSRVFGNLPRDRHLIEHLEELFNSFRELHRSKEEPSIGLENAEPDSEDAVNYEYQLDSINEELSYVEREIESILDRFNRESGYNSKTDKVTKPLIQCTDISG